MRKKLLIAALLAATTMGALAQTGPTSMPDPNTVVTSASNLAYAVGALVASVVTFFLGVKIVKWIRK